MKRLCTRLLLAIVLGVPAYASPLDPAQLPDLTPLSLIIAVLLGVAWMGRKNLAP